MGCLYPPGLKESAASSTIYRYSIYFGNGNSKTIKPQAFRADFFLLHSCNIAITSTLDKVMPKDNYSKGHDVNSYSEAVIELPALQLRGVYCKSVQASITVAKTSL